MHSAIDRRYILQNKSTFAENGRIICIMKKPKDLSILSKEELIKIINDLFMEIDALKAEMCRAKKSRASLK